MPRWTAGWKLEGGLSRILETLAVEIGFEAGPFSADGLVRPLSQLKQPRPIDLTIALRRAASGRLADRVRWRLSPQGSLSARILFPGNAFLGNFRVAQRQFAIQWSAVGLVEAGVDLNALQGLWGAQGLETVRASSDKAVFAAIVQALELAEPERYAPGSFWRDWVDSDALREEIRRNLVQAHLQSRYPIPGRIGAQRRIVVQAYRRAARFLSQMKRWRESAGSMEDLDVPLQIPVFLVFHLLCPPGQRRSALVVSGDLHRVWGDPALLEEAIPRG